MQFQSIIAAAALTVAGIVSTSSAATLAYEPFNYTTTPLTNGTPTNATGFTGNISVIDPGGNPLGGGRPIVAGLTYPALPTTGGAITVNGFNRVSEFLTSSINTATPVAYASFLIKGSGNSGGDPVGALIQGSTASLFAGFGGGFSGTDTTFGLGSTTVGTTPSGVTGFVAGGNISNTATHLIVIQANLLANTFSLYIDPTAGTAVPPVLPAIATFSLDIGNLTGFSLQTIGGTVPTFDEVRFGQTFADVVGVEVAGPAVPEPATLGLLSIGGLGLLARRRKA